MKTEKNMKQIFVWSVLVLICTSFLFAGTCFAKEPKNVAVLPFVMNASQDLSFLQKGIFDMFSSRLTYGDEVAVLTREVLDEKLAASSIDMSGDVTESKARQIGQAIGVDYVVFGSLTIFGQSMSLDTRMVDIMNDTPGLSFFRQAPEVGALIPELNEITTEINFKVFGRRTEEFMAQQPYQGQMMGGQGGNYGSPLVHFSNLLTAKSGINGLSIGDVDGDKKNEVVVVYDSAIEIFKFTFNGRLSSIKKIEDAHTLQYIGVDVADVNQNGYAEIFLTRIKPKEQKVVSYVIEYDGAGFKEGSVEYPWYFRAVTDSTGKNKTVYAQVHSKEGPYVPLRVFEVQSDGGGAYSQGNALNVPDGFSIMSLVAGSMFTKGKTNYVFTDQVGRLTIFNDSGREEWSGEKGYGGSTLFYPFKINIGKDDLNLAYFQPRNVLYDLDSDGKDDLIVVKNNESSNYMFNGYRKFKTGAIEIMAWNDLGLSPERAPKKLPGMVTDIQIGDFDNDSKMELVVSFKETSESLFNSDDKSMVIAYDL